MTDFIINNDGEKLYVFDHKNDDEQLPVFKIKKGKMLKTKATFPM